MKSEVLPSFWQEYRQLNNEVRERARLIGYGQKIRFIRLSILSALTQKRKFGQCE